MPSNGAAPGLQDLVAGGVEIAPVLAAGSALADRRRQGEEPGGAWPTSRSTLVPERADAEGRDRQRLDDGAPGAASPRRRAFRPKRATSSSAAIKKIAASKEYNDFMTQRGFGVIYEGPDDFAKFMAKSDTDLGATMKAVGIVK